MFHGGVLQENADRALAPSMLHPPQALRSVSKRLLSVHHGAALCKVRGRKRQKQTPDLPLRISQLSWGK